MKNFALILIGLMLLVSNSLAKEDYCSPTSVKKNDYEPQDFNTSNNLLSKAGEKDLFCGERIIIFGRVIDANCQPVADAKIYLWQVGCNGQYPYTPLKTRIDRNLIKINQEQTFTGNGIATTNNHGEFVFVTTYPNQVHNLPPHVNIRVEHHNLPSIQTLFTLQGLKIYTIPGPIRTRSIVDFINDHNVGVYGVKITLPKKT